MKTKQFIVRGDRSGVFFGEIKERNGKEATMTNVRQIWRWDGAASIHQLAKDGTARPDGCKFTVWLDELTITDCIEVIQCTPEAITSIKSVKEWRF